MIIGVIMWTLRKRRADVVDVVAGILWAVLGAGLLGLLGAMVYSQG